jgi:Ala-tRNA(Pro) deacylase
MTIAHTVKEFLEQSGVEYAVVPHPHSESSRQTAQVAHVPTDQLAKAVVLMDEVGYLMAVLPGDRHVGVETLSKKLGRKLELAAESRLVPVFKDCDPGAIPPLGPAYGMQTVLDDRLVGLPHIYFEAGDHEDLVRVDGEQFIRLMKEAQHGQFSY